MFIKRDYIVIYLRMVYGLSDVWVTSSLKSL